MNKRAIKKLFELVEKTCNANGVKLYVGNGKYVTYNNKTKVNGYFDGDMPKLAFTKNVKNWELVLVHEYCHMLQWIEDCKEWKEYCKLISDPIADCLGGKEVNVRTLHKQIYATINMERDCEQRAIKIQQELKVSDKDLDEYIRKANAYTIFYLFLLHHKQWYKIGFEPYNVSSVWKKFSNSFDISIEKEYEKNQHLYWNCVDK